MPWSAGTYTRGFTDPSGPDRSGTQIWQDDSGDSIKIESDRHDLHDQDLAVGIDSCLAKDGSNAMTGAINLGGFVPINGGAAVVNDDYATFGQTIQLMAVSANKLLQSYRPDMPGSIDVDLTTVMDGAGTGLAFDTGTNILSLPRQNSTSSEVNLSSLTTTKGGWGAPRTSDYTINPGEENNVAAGVTVTVAAGFSAGDVITIHASAHTGSGVVTIMLLTNGYTLSYGGTSYGSESDLLLNDGDTVSLVALSATELEVI